MILSHETLAEVAVAAIQIHLELFKSIYVIFSSFTEDSFNG